jgi:hypothetical protein
MADSVALAVKDAAEPLARSRDADNSPVGVNPIIAEARRRWQKCQEAEDAQRKSILEAKKFRAGDQWPEAIKIQRQGSSAIQGIAAQPARPCLTIDRLSQPIRQLSNQIKQAAFSIDVLPNGFGADQETAEILQGYLRRVQNNARTEGPIEWAADGAIEGGIGWFRIRTDYVYESWDGDPMDPAAYDQELKLDRITNNLTVYCDPSAVKPTRSDALFMLVTEDLDRDEFSSRWPDADVASIDDFVTTGDLADWASQDTIRIAEYWRITFTDEKIEDGQQSRVVRRPKVEGFKITATEILEQWDWLGSRIPLIPILGEELNIDGRPVLRGVINEGMDAQRMVNYTYSGAMEIFALAPKSPFIAAAGQIDNYLDMWKTANTFNYAYLPYDPVSIGGDVLPPPQRNNAEPPIQAAVMLMRTSEEAIKASTGVYDPALEYNNPREHSGKAIQSLQAQSEITASNYPMHVQRALIYAGELMVEIIPKITRPGQVIQIMGADEEPEQVMVGVPFQKGPDGQPQPAAQHQPDLTDFYDFKKGKYAVTVTVGKGSATRREEGAAALADLIPHLPPEMAAVATPDYVEQLSFPGAHKIAEKLKRALPPQLQDQPEGGPDPEKQQMQGMIQQLQQALQGKQMEEQAKQQGALQKAQLDAQTSLQQTQMEIQSRERIALIQASTTMNVAQGKIDAEDARTFVDAMENRVAGLLELHMAKLGKVHEALAQQQDQVHEVGLTAMQHQHEADQAERAAQQMAAQPDEAV